VEPVPPLRLRAALRRLVSLAWYRQRLEGIDLDHAVWGDLPTMGVDDLQAALTARPPDGGFRHPDVVRVLEGPVPVPLTRRDLDAAAPPIAMALRRAGISSDLAVDLCLPFDGGGSGWWLVDALTYLGCRVWPGGANPSNGLGGLVIAPGDSPGTAGPRPLLTVGPPDADIWLHPIGGVIAARCANGGRVHPLAELAAVELAAGELVVSNLERQALPTLRLRTGWPVRLIEGSCACGAAQHLVTAQAACSSRPGCGCGCGRRSGPRPAQR